MPRLSLFNHVGRDEHFDGQMFDLHPSPVIFLRHISFTISFCWRLSPSIGRRSDGSVRALT